jgi:hypothetical protein
MALPTKQPLDLYPYPRDSSSRIVTADIPAGQYAYVMDADGKIWATIDAPHQHPKVLGGALPAAAAGELTIEPIGVVALINNLSGTFQCAPETVDLVVAELERLGFKIAENAVIRYPQEFF